MYRPITMYQIVCDRCGEVFGGTDTCSALFYDKSTDIEDLSNWKMIDGKSPQVFKKYRKELKDVINGTLFNYVKDAFRIQLNKYTTDEIVSNRDMVEKAIEAHLSKALLKEIFS